MNGPTNLVLAADPGIAHVGYGLVGRYGAKLDLIDSGHVSTPPDWELEARLRKIWRDLAVTCKTYRPHVFAIENQAGVRAGARMSAKRQLEAARQGREIKAFGFNANTDAVAEVVGVMKAIAFSYGIPIALYTPQQAKIAVCGKGNGGATKQQVIAAVRHFFPGIENCGQRLGEHEADAIAGAIHVERVTLLDARRAASRSA